MSRGKTIISAYGSSLLGIVSALLTNVWLLRELARAVDKPSFGLYGLALQVTSYLAILQAGLDFAVSRQIAEALGRHDFDMANRALRELKRFNRRVGIGCVMATVAVALVLRFSVQGETRAGLCAEIALCMGLTQALVFWSRPASSALIGSQLMTFTNLVTVGTSIVTSLLAYVLLRLGWGVLCVPVAGLVTQVAAWGGLIRLCQVHCTWIHAAPQPADGREFKKLFQYGALSTLSGVGWTVESTCDVFILQSVGGAELVAVYVLWWRFPQLAFSACANLTTSAFPSLAQALTDRQENSAQLLAKLFWLQIGLGTMALVGFGIWLPGFIRLWVGETYNLPHASTVALSMGALVCIRAYGNLLATAWLAQGRARLLAAISWTQAILKVGLGMWWARKFGLPGIVLASCVTMSISCCFFAGLLNRQGFLTRGLILKSFLLFVGAVLFSALAAGRLPAPGLIGFALGTLLTALVWGGVWLVSAWRGELGPRLRQLEAKWLPLRGAAP